MSYISVKRCELLTETGLYKCLLLLLLLLLLKGNAESTKTSCQCTKPTELGYILTQKEEISDRSGFSAVGILLSVSTEALRRQARKTTKLTLILTLTPVP